MVMRCDPHQNDESELAEPFIICIIYDSNAFIADVGGYLGLLLGQSAYGIYEILTLWMNYQIKCVEKNSLQ